MLNDLIAVFEKGSLFSQQRQHEVVMIAHDGIGTDINGEDTGQLLGFIQYPRFTVLIAAFSVVIITTKKSSPNTAAGAW
ncbi:hypothetical protein D1Z90_20515 [Motilimonas pumila]|uniref:Uncharacterized protein n=1 Tax=Motilimonas pumila TaxID=2303987 RepID=A0A418Y944_9GAMM|nr:hypothetical protein D1Z90_20515 [Motilimonas pumila]